ncbi:MAG TPA: HXXEE domain-containing protein [Bacillota bacterium]|jgi:hypothetical protein|nr:HXXEE domain-containing protein [Bacillota bacterium]HOL10599.1 HXXEE domain-containing protein [Bacillota bacterium]HPO97426.1 HXXEE domain-containing protein [Bacillota bacterium]
MITLLWLFPIIFMIHDFEEIIMLKPWLKRYGCLLKGKGRFSRIAGRIIDHYREIIIFQSFNLIK